MYFFGEKWSKTREMTTSLKLNLIKGIQAKDEGHGQFNGSSYALGICPFGKGDLNGLL